jgi:2-alkenal reductase
MTWKRILYLFAILVVAGGSALAGAIGGGLAVYQLVRDDLAQVQALGDTPAETLAAENPAGDMTQTMVINSTDVQTTITSVVQRVAPTVVTVVATYPGQQTFFGRTEDSEVSGSGVFISEDGYILTNNHVVENTTKQWVILSDGTQQEATLVGTDRYADLAVLKTEGPVPAVAVLGNSAVLDPGETVIAIGSPLGDFKNSVTVGVVSATGRSIDTGEGYSIEDLIQTDAAINQGNSGGPLVNLAGEVIGINTLVVRSSGTGAVAEGLGFAIPTNTVQAVAQQIIEKGYFARPYIGITFQAISPSVARMYRLPVEWGVYITRVASGSPAETAGLQVGDIITTLGDTALDETHSYLNVLFGYQPGDQVSVGFNRDGTDMEATVTLGENK